MKEVNRYQEYRDSETKWLGDIPSHWNIKKLRSLCSIKTGSKNTDDRIDGGEYPFFVRSKKVERINSYSFNGEAILTAGDGDIGKIFHHINGKFDFHQRVYAFYNFKINPRFLYHYLTSNLYHKVKSESAKVTVGSIRLPMLENFLVSVPSIQEQEAIAYFLDDKVGDITALIHTIDGQIENFKDYKKAMIRDFTTGKKILTAETPIYKDSRIAWIGNIPNHWSVLHLKNVINYETGNTPDTKKEDYFTQDDSIGSDWVNISDLQDKFLYKTENYLTKEGVESKNMKKVKPNSLLFSFKLSVGNCSFNRHPVYTNEAIASFRENKNVSLKFLYYVLKNNFKENGKKNIYGAYIMNRHLIENASIALPSKAEQEEIANFLDNKIMDVDKLIKNLKKQKQNLIDYKKVLINDLVTGKIKVYKEELN